MAYSTEIFTPLTDDRHAEAVSLTEYATVKPSGYIIHRGIFPVTAETEVLAGIRDYFQGKGRPEPVIIHRPVGAATWLIVGSPTVTIPDALPEDFQ